MRRLGERRVTLGIADDALTVVDTSLKLAEPAKIVRCASKLATGTLNIGATHYK